MSQLFIVLLPILIADVINPILLAGTLFGLGSSHPFRNSTAILLSFFVTYFLSGVIIAEGLDQIMELYHLPPIYDYILELFIALLLFFSAYKMYKGKEIHPEDQLVHTKTMTLRESLWMGLQINLIGLPFAIPYFAAIDQMFKAEIHKVELIYVLFLYNIAYVLPFSLLILIRYISKERSHALFRKINHMMHDLSVKYLPAVFFILGLILLEDCISYLIGYREYSLLRVR